QETVQLRFRQRKGAHGSLRILRCDNKKRLGQLVGHAVDRDAVFFHRFQKRALCLWGRAVDLVDQHHLRKKWTTMKNELLLVAVEDGIAENVGRQQIAGKLDALKGEG